MLDALDSVNWGSLRGCYRTAEDVPVFLRALLSPVAEIRERGWEELLSAVWHQGTVYEVSAPVVPFLYELLESDAVPDRGLVADLIATLADAHAYLEIHTRTPEEAARWEAILAREGKTLAVERARELGYVAAVRQAVRARLDVLYPYLRNSDPMARGAAARAVGCFPEIAARMLPDLEAAIEEEPDDYLRAVLEDVIQIGRTSAAPNPAPMGGADEPGL